MNRGGERNRLAGMMCTSCCRWAGRRMGRLLPISCGSQAPAWNPPSGARVDPRQGGREWAAEAIAQLAGHHTMAHDHHCHQPQGASSKRNSAEEAWGQRRAVSCDERWRTDARGGFEVGGGAGIGVGMARGQGDGQPTLSSRAGGAFGRCHTSSSAIMNARLPVSAPPGQRPTPHEEGIQIGNTPLCSIKEAHLGDSRRPEAFAICISRDLVCSYVMVRACTWVCSRGEVYTALPGKESWLHKFDELD